MQNSLCDSKDLHNEADVEALFVEPLLQVLGYPSNRIRRKASIEELVLPTTGAHGERYRPDYVLMDSAGRPVMVLDAKSPTEKPGAYRYQVTGYALLINQRHEDNPIRYCVVSNGLVTELLEWDREQPVMVLRFQDFDSGNALFTALRSTTAYEVFNQQQAVKAIRPDYQRPTIGEVIAAFGDAHQIIWKKEKIGPTKAFYELAKLLFVKLRQDRRIHELIGSGKSPRADDFYFTVSWIDRQPTPNPIAEQLFGAIQNELEAEIRAGNKKRIFLAGESIDLRPSTIVEVVRLLEGHDLHGIDEDLNGRMFETFLNATVRGKELGQYFTPRPVVKYMTKTARLQVIDRKLPRVIDACCGSGGFLIEALAELSYAIKNSGQFTNSEKTELQSALESDTLYGVEANDEIGRVARLNMYLHGDGGSRIYIADTLDKELIGEPGPVERQQQHDELRERILGQELRFNVALTNPPFSMSYSSRVASERRILDQYEISGGRTRQSNVLFLERYKDLLEEDGELLTVIDDTVLNGVSAAYARRFIRKHFVVRQVVSLPFNTFYRAQAGSKTSILHLRRRRPGEQQGDVFMAIANNVGHDDYKKDTPHRDNLPEIANLFIEWDELGKEPRLIRENEDLGEPMGCPMQVFVVPAEKLADRLDAFYYAPHLRELHRVLEERATAKKIGLKRGRDFNLTPRLKPTDKAGLRGQQLPYVEIGGVTRNGMILEPLEALFEDMPSRAELQLEKSDVLFARCIRSRGIAVIAPAWMDGGLATSGFISVRPRDEDEALILWSVFRSEIWKRQVYYLSVTATQPEVREDTFLEEMLIPWPANEDQKHRILESARRLLRAHDEERQAATENRQTLDGLFLA